MTGFGFFASSLSNSEQDELGESERSSQKQVWSSTWDVVEAWALQHTLFRCQYFNLMPNDSSNWLGITPFRMVVFLVPEPWSFHFIKEAEKVNWISWFCVCQFQMQETTGEKLSPQALRLRKAYMILRDRLSLLTSLWPRNMEES